jgi:polyisoprenoid-binding protein YceI
MNGNRRNAVFARMFGFVIAGALVAGWWGADRSHAGTTVPALPAPGAYQVDPNHSFVYFSAWHHIVGVVRGRFDRVTGTITAAPNPSDCAVDITIDTATINTQNSQRDDDLRGPDFFAVKQFPTATYKGRGLRRSGTGWVMDGTLTIRGVSRTVPLTFSFKGIFPDTPAGQPPRAAFHGTAAMHRGDFGMTRDNAEELGVPPAPGADVALEIDVEADKSQTP